MMNSPDQFVGGQFSWFTGVVEDILDPLQMGRVRVRCYGYHTSDLKDLPTSDLPWASVMLPITSSGMSGIGQSATGLKPGSWVIGFFRDGPSAQDPLIMGSIPSISTGSSKEKGFSDPSGINPFNPGQIDTPVEATSQYSDGSTFIKKRDSRQEKIETAVPPKVSSVADDKVDSYYTRSTWSNLSIEDRINPSYPNNHVWHTQGGHVIEHDDTNESKRISEMHASGTYREIDNSGNHTLTVVGSDYTVIFKDSNVYIKGACNLTIDKDLRMLVKGNYHLEVEGDYTQNIKGSLQTKIGGNEEKEIQHTLSENVGKDQNLRVGGNETILISGDKNETISQSLNQNVVSDASYTITGKKNEIYLEDLSIVTNGKLYLTAQSGIQMETPGNIDVNTDGNMNVIVVGDINETVSGNQTTTVSGTITIEGSTIDLNP